MKFTAFALLALLAFAAVAFASQDEALDAMALNEVEAVPRLLAEVLSTRVRGAGAYGDAMDGAYGQVITPEAPTIPTTTETPRATSSAAATSAGLLSFAAAVVALAMF